MTSDPNRRPWTEGPVADVPPESWQALDDDTLLHRIETLDPEQEADAWLVEVMQSSRHFFIRQAAAKRIRKRALLFAYEDDRHIGQILVRHLTRREDITYLERLLARSQHAEVRRAAQTQLSRLVKKFSTTAGTATTRASAALKTRSWRVAVLHGDDELRTRVVETLSPPEFRSQGFRPHEDAAAEIEAFDPHLVLADVNEARATREIHDALRQRSLRVPLVVLCPPDMSDPLVDVLGRGADEFIMLPLHPPLLAAKTRALLHFAHRSAGKAERRTLSGSIGPEGVLAVFRLCEEKGMTCRLVVVTDEERRWVDFEAGEMTEAGGEPPVPDEECLAALLSVRSGRYEVLEHADEEPRAQPQTATATGVISGLAPAAATAPTPPSPVARQRDDVDATLLGWAIHFIVEPAWAYLGTTATAGLLRRTHQEMIGSQPLLRFFVVEEKAQVRVDISQGVRLPRGAVAAVAEWMSAFLGQAQRVVADAAGIQVRQATALMADALDQAGFYAAYDRASGRSPTAS
jgi:CheY-like chemotaxis protein